MSREFRLPDLGSGLQEAQIVSWQVAVGDRVSMDATLCEVETEKAVIEVPVPYSGVVLKLAANEGEAVAVGDVLAVIGEAGEQPAGEADTDASAPTDVAQARPAHSAPSPGGNGLNAAASAKATGGRPRAMPSIRRLAKELSVDLHRIAGTGKRGRITRDDVTHAARAGMSGAAGSAGTTVAVTTAAAADRREPLSKLRRTIADHMARSWREIPHCFTRLEIDATRFLETRKSLSDHFGRKLPVEALLIKAVIPVLREHPQFNATLDGDELLLRGRYDIGVAADTPDGLIVPVVQQADALSLIDLADRLTDLLTRTAERRAAPEELTGATFTVNNIGALGHVMGTSIIPYGTTAIMSVGRALEKAVVRNAQITVKPMMEVTLSFDHRVVDGGQVQRFMTALAKNLEEPVRFLA